VRLPNADQAVISPEKLRDYLLSPGHRRGSSKSEFFSALGYNRDRWVDLERHLREQHLVLDAEAVELTVWGVLYAIVGPIAGPSGEKAIVRSIWIIETGQGTPRFVPAYPGR
jgi:hypothetical protein